VALQAPARLPSDALLRSSPRGEGQRTFLKANEAESLARADEIDALRNRGAKLPEVSRILFSIKDLFNAQGEVTTAGSVMLKNAAPANADAAAVARLRAAGFIVIGRTNMTEFVYSGVGLNPLFETPKSLMSARAAASLPDHPQGWLFP
jgi:aspartyl-tRNA(Asn)/glutamyl-tRNA(Gln) amidotransferase subunit A